MISLRDLTVRLMLHKARRAAHVQFGRLPADAATALVIPPTSAGSTGDAAMLNATRMQLRQRGFTKVVVALSEGWDAIEGFDRYMPADDWFFYNRRSALARLIGDLGFFSHSFLIGADCIDGTYNSNSIIRRMTLLNEHAKLGGRARIMGSSFSNRPDANAVQRIKTLDPAVTICARDPFSRERLEVATGRDIIQSADLAFMTGSDPVHSNAANALAFIAAQRDSGRSVIGLNINCVVEQQHPGFTVAHRGLVQMLLEKGLSLLLVPHDSRGEVNDATLLKRAIAEVPHDLLSRIAWLHESPPAATRSTLAKLDAIITSRMHAAILAMSANVPAISFVYQGKFEGLYNLLGLENDNLLFDPAEFIENPSQICASIALLLQQNRALATKVVAGMAEVLEMAGRNFGE